MLLAFVFAPVVIVVSPSGPIRSVESGVDQANELLRQGAPRVEVQVRPGSYYVSHGISLESNLSIRGVGRKLPRLIGGKRLVGWHAVIDPDVLSRLTADARANVQECDLTGSDTIDGSSALSERGFGHPMVRSGAELFFNGKPMQLARYPNVDAPDGGWLRIATVPAANTITYPGTEPSRWKSIDGVYAFGYWQYDWADSYEQVTGIDTVAKSLAFGNGHFSYPPKAGRRFYFLNVLEELDKPGEWYMDNVARKLYFWPPSPIKDGETIVSTLPSDMFQVHDASNIEISGLDIESGQANAISVQGGTNNWVRNCVIRNFGDGGVSIVNATNSGVTGCDLTGLGEFGITLDGGNRKTLTPANLVAEDNHIWGYSRWCRTYRPAVSLSGVGNRASHNWIHDAPHQAILVSGNDHAVEYNDIENVCTETGDAGAIYMGRDTTMRGDSFRFNRITGLSPKVNTQGNFTEVMGIYLDDCWAGAEIYGNIFDMRGTAIMLGGGRDNTINNNVFLNCNPAIHFDARGKGWAAAYMAGWEFAQKMAFVNPKLPPYSTRYPKLANIQSVDFAFPAGNVIDSNIALGGQWLRLLDNLTTKDFEDRDNVVVNKAGSLGSALKLAPRSFKPIPVGKIGVETRRRPSSRL